MNRSDGLSPHLTPFSNGQDRTRKIQLMSGQDSLLNIPVVLFPFRSPLLRISQLFYTPPLNNMLKFSGFNLLESGTTRFGLVSLFEPNQTTPLGKLRELNRIGCMFSTETNNTPKRVFCMCSEIRGRKITIRSNYRDKFRPSSQIKPRHRP